MALAGRGVLAIWNGVEDGAEDDFVAWHVREHIPERVGVPGFLRGRRYVAERGEPGFFNFYETQTPATLDAPPYLERLNAPTPWTTRVIARFRATSRTICSVVESRGLGDGGFVATVRLRPRGPRSDFVAAMGKDILSPLLEAPRIVAAHLLEGEGAGNAATLEKSLRKTPDATVDWLLLVEATDRAPLEAAMSARAASLAAIARDHDPARDSGVYRLQFALSAAQL